MTKTLESPPNYVIANLVLFSLHKAEHDMTRGSFFQLTEDTSKMPVRAYTFKVELLDSRDPVITRTFTIPASWTFYKLHAAIQYTFGWQDCHLHFFTFEQAALGRGPALLRIESGDSEEYGDFNVGGGTSVIDTKIRLSDVWEERGKYRQDASHNGTLGTCCYLYDFGVRCPYLSRSVLN